jgi:Cu/Ag efflux pump CusA
VSERVVQAGVAYAPVETKPWGFSPVQAQSVGRDLTGRRRIEVVVPSWKIGWSRAGRRRIDGRYSFVFRGKRSRKYTDREPIEIKLFSQDPELLSQWAPRVADAIKNVSGVVDLKDGIESTTSGPATTFQVNPTIAARSGFTLEEVAVDAAAMLEGEPAATALVANDRAYTIRVRYPDENHNSPDAMSNTVINSASGKTATLGGLSAITQIPGQTEIRHEDLQRDVAVTARLEGRDMGSGVRDVQSAVAALHLPPSIRVVYGGTFEQQQQSFRDLLLVLILAIVLVFVVLLFEFRILQKPP